MLPNPHAAADSRAFLEFVWEGQEGLFELAPTPAQRFRATKRQALESYVGCTYFAPLARKVDGGTKDAVADVANVVWADVDSSPGPDWLRQRLSTLGLIASAIVFSGRGHWVYVKLTELIRTDELEALNRGLALLLDADSCWERNRLARLPGSINGKTGLRAEVIDFSGVLHTPQSVRQLKRMDSRAQAPVEASPSSTLGGYAFPAAPRLGSRAWAYIAERPSRSPAVDRSVEEQRIFFALVGQGWPEEAIVAFADAYKLPRHREERQRRGNYSWTLTSIKSAQSALPDADLIEESNYSHMCRETATSYLSRSDLLRQVNGQTTGEIVKAVVATGRNRATVYRALSQLRTGGYLTTERSGREVVNRLTEKGLRALAPGFRRAIFLPTLENVRDGGGSGSLRGW